MTTQVSLYGINGKEIKKKTLPDVFSQSPRKDLISRAVISIETKEKQAQGREPIAGQRTTANSWGSGFGVARAPRRKGSGFPTARNAAFVPGVVGGRLPHPPRAEKKIHKNINRKERKKALLSAISASGKKDWVEARGHIVEDIPSFPLVIDNEFQGIKNTSDVLEVFENLGLLKDISRAKFGKKIRAGKGKRRGRKYKRRKSVLIVIKDNLGIYKAARNLPGVDIVDISRLNCKNLAPGSKAGRLTLWVESAFDELNKFGE
jgi:large subunit ribosomal protein L4e